MGMFIHPLHSAAFGIYANAAKVVENAIRITNLTTLGYSRNSGGIRAEAYVPETGLPRVSTEVATDFDEEWIPEPVQDREFFLLDIAEELVQIRMAFHGYRANIAALKTQDNMIGSILDIIA